MAISYLKQHHFISSYEYIEWKLITLTIDCILQAGISGLTKQLMESCVDYVGITIANSAALRNNGRLGCYWNVAVLPGHLNSTYILRNWWGRRFLLENCQSGDRKYSIAETLVTK